MAKAKSRFVCRECGAVYPKWQGQCHECGAWNTLEEEAAPVAPPRAGKGGAFVVDFLLQDLVAAELGLGRCRIIDGCGSPNRRRACRDGFQRCLRLVAEFDFQLGGGTVGRAVADTRQDFDVVVSTVGGLFPNFADVVAVGVFHRHIGSRARLGFLFRPVFADAVHLRLLAARIDFHAGIGGFAVDFADIGNGLHGMAEECRAEQNAEIRQFHGWMCVLIMGGIIAAAA